MSFKRVEIIEKNREWINNHLRIARANLADGYDVLCSNIDPIIEICETKKQHNLFRILIYSDEQDDFVEVNFRGASAPFFMSNIFYLRKEREILSQWLMCLRFKILNNFYLLKMAERQGFEPWVPKFGTPVFETGLFNHSSISPIKIKSL